MRFCIVSRQRYPQSALVRLARTEEGRVVVDSRRLLPGRGAWVLETHLDELTPRALSRAFRAKLARHECDKLVAPRVHQRTRQANASGICASAT